MKKIKPSVLVIYDEDFGILVLRNILEEQGLSVETARDGCEGIEKAKAIRPTLILLDGCIAGMDCFAVCRALKCCEATKRIPVIIMKEFETDVLRLACLRVVANELLVKPFHNSELVDRVRKLLQLHN